MIRESVLFQFNGNLATRVIFLQFFINFYKYNFCYQERKVMKCEKNRMMEGFLIKLAKWRGWYGNPILIHESTAQLIDLETKFA